jgi:hypothetical protein
VEAVEEVQRDVGVVGVGVVEAEERGYRCAVVLVGIGDPGCRDRIGGLLDQVIDEVVTHQRLTLAAVPGLLGALRALGPVVVVGLVMVHEVSPPFGPPGCCL